MLGVGIIRRDSCVVNHPFRSVSCRILRQQIRPYLPGRFTKWGHPSYPENPPDVQKERSSVAIAVSAGAGASVRATAQARRMWPSSGSAGGVGADYGCSEPTTGARSRLGALGADRPGRDLQQLTALVIDLEGRVVQAEALVQHPLELAARGMAVAIRRDEHMGRQGREAARHLPHAQVVDLGDAGLGHERLADRTRVEALGGGL